MSRAQEQKLLQPFGNCRAQARKNKGMPQQALAEATNMSVVAIAYIETGKRWVRPLTLSKIASALRVRPAEFFKDL